jgi:hypothetical protein
LTFTNCNQTKVIKTIIYFKCVLKYVIHWFLKEIFLEAIQIHLHMSEAYSTLSFIITRFYKFTSWNTRRCPGGIQDKVKEIEFYMLSPSTL